jgi:hypothetical protein
LLFQKYSPKVIYCCSDEVTIVYSSFKEERFVPLSGRIQKISSMVKHSSLLFSQFSSHFTSNFNKVLRDKIEEFKEYPNYKRIQEKMPPLMLGFHFLVLTTSRVFNVKDEEEAFQNCKFSFSSHRN